MKNIKNKFANIDYFLIFFLLIYLYLILTWYYKPPWIIDHLTYVLTALPQRIDDLKFWHSVSSNLPEGTLSERWAILVPIIIFNKLLFFLPPHLSSQVFIIFNWLLILILSYYLVKKIYSATNAKIFLIIFVLGIHHTKNRATEILADPVGVLLVLLLFFINYFVKSDRKYYWIGSLFFLIPMTKIHYGIFLIFFCIVYFKNIIFKLPKIIIGILLSVLFCELIFFINYENDIFYKINQNTYDTLIYYFTEGGSRWKAMKGDLYWSTVWLSRILENIFLPQIFLILFIKYFFNIKKDVLFENLTVIFLILIFTFAYFVSFPGNDTYAYPIYVFSIIFFSNFIMEIKPDKMSNKKYLIIILLTFMLIFPLIYFYQNHVTKTHKYHLFLGEFLFVFSIFYVPIIFSKFKNYTRFFLILPIIFITFFSHNYYNINQHYLWRNGYNKQYEYFNATADLIKTKNSNYLVVYETWPLSNRPKREKLYPKLALQNMTRKNVTVDFKYLISDIDTVNDFLITDKLLNKQIQNNLNLSLVDKRKFFSTKYNKDLMLFLFEKN